MVTIVPINTLNLGTLSPTLLPSTPRTVFKTLGSFGSGMGAFCLKKRDRRYKTDYIMSSLLKFVPLRSHDKSSRDS